MGLINFVKVLMFSLCVFFFGLIVACYQRDHLLSVLLGIEFLRLGCFCVARGICASRVLPILMVMFCFSAAEVGVILSLLVLIARAYGNDRCRRLFVDKC